MTFIYWFFIIGSLFAFLGIFTIGDTPVLYFFMSIIEVLAGMCLGGAFQKTNSPNTEDFESDDFNEHDSLNVEDDLYDGNDLDVEDDLDDEDEFGDEDEFDDEDDLDDEDEFGDEDDLDDEDEDNRQINTGNRSTYHFDIFSDPDLDYIIEQSRDENGKIDVSKAQFLANLQGRNSPEDEQMLYFMLNEKHAFDS